jgi:ribosome-binding factor A
MSGRVEQVNQLIKKDVGEYLQENIANETGFLTITAVEVTADLRLATIWFTYIGEDTERVFENLKKEKRNIQRYINKRFVMKNVPKLIFRYDNSGDYAVEISKAIKDAKDN